MKKKLWIYCLSRFLVHKHCPCKILFPMISYYSKHILFFFKLTFCCYIFFLVKCLGAMWVKWRKQQVKGEIRVKLGLQPWMSLVNIVLSTKTTKKNFKQMGGRVGVKMSYQKLLSVSWYKFSWKCNLKLEASHEEQIVIFLH